MATTLRDFITSREGEIREQMKALRSEMKELQLAKAALGGQGDAPESAAASSAPTIKDMAKAVLAKAEKGLTANEILDAIKAEFQRAIERTSLSPQLSRLKDTGDVVLHGDRWWTPDAYRKFQDELVAAFDAEPDFSESVNFDANLGADDDDVPF